MNPCALCGWIGERKFREVNYAHALLAWVCARCFHADVYAAALARRGREAPVWL